MFQRTSLVCAVLLCALVLAPPRAHAHGEPLAVVSAASLNPSTPVSPDSLVSVFGIDLAPETAVAPTADLPFELAGLRAAVTGSDDVSRPARLVFVSALQVNLLLPAGLPPGDALLALLRGEVEIGEGQLRIQAVSPGIFSAAGSGVGPAAALATRIAATGEQVVEPIVTWDPRESRHVPIPLNPAAGPLYLSLYGTGLRGGSAFRVLIADQEIPVAFAGAQSQFPGLDQVNVGPLPASLAGLGLAEIRVEADGLSANVVQAAFSEPESAEVTFSNQISRLLQTHCQVCHRPGEIAPFPLLDYDDVQPRASRIRSVVAARQMPPWSPVAGHGRFLNDRSLSQEEIGLIVRWVEAGTPEGDPANLPAPAVFSDSWTLGEPDLELALPQPFVPVPGGDDEYRCFSLPTGLPEDVSVSQVEVLPGDRSIVHHVVLFVDIAGASAGLSGGDGRSGYPCFGGPGFDFADDSGEYTEVLGVWAPGNGPLSLPAGVAYRLRANSRIVMQVHYHPSAEPRQDLTRVGLHASPDDDPTPVLLAFLEDEDFTIPAGESAASVDIEATLEDPIRLNVLAVLPHMHLLGRKIHVDRVETDGALSPLVHIDDWSFDWQDTYFFEQPATVSQGEGLRVECVYDNSATNPNNPNNPPQPVSYGERTVDEMCLAILFLTVDFPAGP